MDISPDHSADTSKSKQTVRKHSSLACIVCRHRHLKCDGIKPVCGRCQTAGLTCRFVQSRRGYNRGPDTNQSSSALVPTVPGGDSLQDAFTSENGLEGATPGWLLDESAFSNDVDLGTFSDLENVLDLALGNPIQPVQEENMLQNLRDDIRAPYSSKYLAFDPLIQLYYQNFHDSHPFLLPRRCLDGQLAESLPPYLISAMRLVGASYHYDQSVKDLHRKTAWSATTDSVPSCGFKVQAMLLIAIADHAHGFALRSIQIIRSAIDVALELGMDKPSFASQVSQGSAVLEESWKRTYWELYVVSSMISVMGDNVPFPLNGIKVDLQLPCDDRIYAAAKSIPQEQTLEQLQNSWACGSIMNFSSFAFRIEAVRLLVLVSSLNTSWENTDEHEADLIEARITSLMTHLPAAQRELYDAFGYLDEMKIQTQMMCSLALILLHQPRSNVHFGGLQKIASCTQLQALHGGQPQIVFDLRSVKMLKAADTLSHLATLPSPIRRRSPFMICALAICILVHSGSCKVLQGTQKEEAIRVRIQLALGGLNMLGEVWPLARSVKQQALSIFKQTMSAKMDDGRDIQFTSM